jgi:NtrC-family two-component system sensor histidine kinase KinB
MIGLRSKILLAFGGLLAILLVVSAVSTFVFSRYSGATQQMLEADYTSVSACQNMEDSVDKSNMLLEQALLADAGDVSPQLAEQSRDFDSAMSDQRQSINLPGELEATNIVQRLWNVYRESLVAVADMSKPISQRRSIYERVVQPQAEELLAATRHITELNRTNATSTKGEAQRLAHNAMFALHVLTAAAVVFGVAFSIAIGRMILRPLGSLTRSVQEIRGGNLDASVPVESSDELGHLGAAFNEMAEQLRVFKRIDHEKLMRTQRTTQLAIDSLPDPVLVLSPSGRVELTNDAARRWFGVNPGDAPPETLWNWIDQALRKMNGDVRAVTEAAPTDDATGYESSITLNRDGSERHLLPRAVPIRDEQQRIIGATVVLNDVTGLRRLDQMKSGLLALVSHELKTPLTSMRMILHLLADDRPATASGQEMRELLVAARDDSDRLHQIVENLLDMGRIEAGRVLMELKPIGAAELIERAVEPLRPAYAEHGVELRIDSIPADSPVMADATRMGHVFSNLLANALRYTPAGGSVRVGSRALPDALEIYVADTGCGVPREHLHRLFEKFYRVPSQSRGGAGLGLAIVKDIVEAHGGRIAIESEEGRGTTVRFTLNRAGASEKGERHELASAIVEH